MEGVYKGSMVRRMEDAGVRAAEAAAEAVCGDPSTAGESGTSADTQEGASWEGGADGGRGPQQQDARTGLLRAGRARPQKAGVSLWRIVRS